MDGIETVQSNLNAIPRDDGVLQKHRQPVIFSVYSTLQRRRHVAVTLDTIENGSHAMDNADFYFCYVIKMLITLSSKCAKKNATALSWRIRARLPPTINLSPATLFVGENPG